ncbi:MAG: PAS domain S-box protein [Nitrospirae bacterium]|nr:MAG: PAS domain S-box protein [Nitrospirota bacterium]
MDKQGYVQSSIERLFATWLRLTTVIGAIVFPLFSFLDSIFFYEHFALFLGYRIAIAAFLLLIAFLAGKTTNRMALQSLALAAVIASAVTLEVMILHTGGHASPHVMGMILLAVTILAFVPADLPFHSASAGTIYGIYLIPIYATEQLDDLRTFFIMNFFICSIILTVMAHRYLAMKGIRKQLENEYDLIAVGDRLNENSMNLRAILNNLPFLAWLKDKEGRFLSVNRPFADACGLPAPEAVAGKTDLDVWPAHLAEVYRSDDTRVMESKQKMAVEELVTVQGVLRWFETFKSPVFSINGNVVGTTGFARDITEHKLTEEALNDYRGRLEEMVEQRTTDLKITIEALESEIAQRIDAQEALGRNRLLLQGVFNSIQDGIILLDPDLNIIMNNPAAERMFNSRLPLGYKTMKCFELFRNSSNTCEDCPAVRAMETKVSQSEIISYTTDTAQERWLEIFSFPFLGQDGELRGVIQHLRDITERKQAEETLKESEERFKTLLEDAPIAISIIDRDDTISYFNRKHAEIMGYDQQDIPTLEHWWSQAYPDETDRARIKSAWPDLCRRVFQGEKVPRVDRWIVCKDGTIKELELNFRAAAGKIIVAFNDITERKRAEEKLRRSELHYRTLFEKASEGIIFLNEAGTMVAVNESFARMHGYRCDELIGVQLHELEAQKSFGRDPVIFHLLQAGESLRFEVEHYHAAGHSFPLEVAASLIRLSNENLFVAFHHDISDRRKSETALRESEERYKRLLGSVTDYIYTVTVEDGQAVATSHGEGCHAVTGYSSAQFQADPGLWYRMIHEADRGQVLENARRIIAGMRTEPLEHRIIHSSGSIRWVLSTLVPLFGKHGQLIEYDGLISNITERKMLEEQLNAAWETEALNLKLFFRLLIETQEKERWSIARELHDEIGQSLTGLKLSVESIAGSLPSDQADDMKAIEVSLGEMLDVVRTMSLNLRPVMLEDFGLVSSLQWYFDRYESQTGIAVTFRQTAADRRFGQQKEIALYRITQEALANVARHAGVKSVLVELTGGQDLISLRIQDTGRGFDTMRASSSFSSGLSIMRERTLIENGKFTLSSSPERGTEIIAAIPLDNGEVGQQAAP